VRVRVRTHTHKHTQNTHTYTHTYIQPRTRTQPHTTTYNHAHTKHTHTTHIHIQPRTHTQHTHAHTQSQQFLVDGQVHTVLLRSDGTCYGKQRTIKQRPSTTTASSPSLFNILKGTPSPFNTADPTTGSSSPTFTLKPPQPVTATNSPLQKEGRFGSGTRAGPGQSVTAAAADARSQPSAATSLAGARIQSSSGQRSLHGSENGRLSGAAEHSSVGEEDSFGSSAPIESAAHGHATHTHPLQAAQVAHRYY